MNPQTNQQRSLGPPLVTISDNKASPSISLPGLYEI